MTKSYLKPLNFAPIQPGALEKDELSDNIETPYFTSGESDNENEETPQNILKQLREQSPSRILKSLSKKSNNFQKHNKVPIENSSDDSSGNKEKEFS